MIIQLNILHIMTQIIFDVLIDNIFQEVFDSKFSLKYLFYIFVYFSNHRNDYHDGLDENRATYGK
jgi:hypothetical protein